MKSILLITATSLLMCACNQKNKSSMPTDLAQENLKGKVQEVETESYTADSLGKIGAIDSCCTYIEQLDKDGYTNKYITKDGKGNVKSEQSFVHDENGMMKEMTTMANGKKTSSLKLELKDGKYVLATSFDSTGKMDSYYSNITQNENGQVTGATQYKPDSTLKMSFTNAFDKMYYSGGTSKDSTGKLTYSSTIKLNDKNDQDQLTETTVNKDSSKTTVTTYKYDTWDDQGNWTQQTSYNDKGKIAKVIKRKITYYKQ
ncbi:MAG TPA: hypothetical protein VN958_03245 [Chitinophagaceae bacterium]|nr:hypothetical protein [Chitinophagaceae bacterium]